MTDNEIIKAMQCVIGNDAKCSECTYQKVLPFPSCRRKCAKNALDLINRQKAEIERLRKSQVKEIHIDKEFYEECQYEMKQAKSEAIKEFAERLKAKMRNCSMYCIDEQTYYLISYSLVDNLVKEMTEGKEDEGK